MFEKTAIQPKSTSRNLIFHGTGREYFGVWIVNVLLTIVTLGIFGAWALVRSRRYLYGNTELAGERFSYQATGSAIFISWFFLIIIYGMTLLVTELSYPLISLVIWLFFIVFIPWMLVQGTRYHAMMTSLNQMRFNFHATGLQAWWVLFGFPLVLMIGLILIYALLFYALLLAMTHFMSTSTTITVSIILSLLYVPAIAAILALITAKRLRFMANGLEFGTLKFKVEMKDNKLIVIFLLAGLIFLLFMVLEVLVIAPVTLKMMGLSLGVGMQEALIGKKTGLDIFSFIYFINLIIYLFAILTSYSFLMNRLRCYVLQSTTLDGKVTFRSTTSFKGYLWMVFSNFLLVVCTLSLAYPWAKVRMVRYLTQNTWIEGDLDALNSQDHSEQPPTDILSRLSRGLFMI